jgi:DNA-binding ferritin-like protein
MSKGSSFYEIHRLLEKEYRNVLEYADRVAEYMRTKSNIPPLTLSEVLDLSFIEEGENIQTLSMHEMIATLSSDYDKVGRIANDMVSEDRALNNILDSLSEYINKQSWFMRSYLTK